VREYDQKAGMAAAMLHRVCHKMRHFYGFGKPKTVFQCV
jgi:hypothetical protein